MAKEPPKKTSSAEPPEAPATQADPYLKELDNSMEDILAEEPTRFDIPAETPETKQVGVKAPAGRAPTPSRRPKKSAASVSATVPSEGGAKLSSSIPVPVRVVIGEKKGTLQDLLDLKKGEILKLDRGLDASVDLMVQDKVVARGELVEVDGRLGVRLIRILEGSS